MLTKPGFMVIVANTYRGLWVEHYTGAGIAEVLNHAIQDTNTNLFVDDDHLEVQVSQEGDKLMVASPYQKAQSQFTEETLDSLADLLSEIMTDANGYNIRIAFKIYEVEA